MSRTAGSEFTGVLRQLSKTCRIYASNADKVRILETIETMHTGDEDFMTGLSRLEREYARTMDAMRSHYARLLSMREKSFANRILKRKSKLEDFYKLDQYERRIGFEFDNAVSLLDRKPKTVAFVGCGAVPISSMLMSEWVDSVDAIDRDRSAVQYARALARTHSKNIRIFRSDILDFRPPSEYDLIVIAGTVGITDLEKDKIVGRCVTLLSRRGRVCVRVPMREEILLMATARSYLGRNRPDLFTYEGSTDYYRRLYVSR